MEEQSRLKGLPFDRLRERVSIRPWPAYSTDATVGLYTARAFPELVEGRRSETTGDDEMGAAGAAGVGRIS
ncbi:hypothetical protein ASF51_01215 [Agreia sp. Leaf283]|nr:hypothetical protein ASF51_01215 [Agreia sp. Leaf283]